MRTPAFLLGVFLVFSATILSACGGSLTSPTQTVPGAIQGQAGYQGSQLVEPPEEFKTMTNPMAGSAENAAKGEVIFEADCTSCHGQEAKGDGLAGTSLDPKPADLASKQAYLSDGYLFWRISVGGAIAPFYSAMPAWRGLLSEDHIWKVITYLRTLKG